MKQLGLIVCICGMVLACSPSKENQTISSANTSEETTSQEKMTFPSDSISPDGNLSFHGLRIDQANSIQATDLPGLLAEKGSADGVKVAGKVEAACQMKGCWMTMKIAEDQEMRVRFKDYGFFVPKDAGGKNAVIEGQAYMDTTSVEDLIHYAVDGGMDPKEAEAKYTEPEVAISFLATGVIINNDAAEENQE